jgi:hypothetical protein
LHLRFHWNADWISKLVFICQDMNDPAMADTGLNARVTPAIGKPDALIISGIKKRLTFNHTLNLAFHQDK